MVNVTKVNGLITKSTDMESINGRMDVFIMAIMSRVKEMEKEK